MSNLLEKLSNDKLISPPTWLPLNTIYLTITGSVAYGAADTTVNSDVDIYGVCIPSKLELFPHLAGKLYGFDDINCFQQYQKHHVFDSHALNGKGIEYDINIYNIVKFFKLLMANNPSCIDALFTSHEHILSISQAGNVLRENRKLFLHKGCWAKFKGYSYSMLHKMDSKTPKKGSNRFKLREKFGFDVKYGMHIVRLLLEAEQILIEGDLDLMRHKEQLKSIRRGEWSIKQIKEWAQNKEKQLEELYVKSPLPSGPDKTKIKNILLECLEIHYGPLKNIIVQPDKSTLLLRSIKEQIEKAGI